MCCAVFGAFRLASSTQSPPNSCIAIIQLYSGYIGYTLQLSRSLKERTHLGPNTGNLFALFCKSIFSRMRSEGFPFIVGGLGVGAVFAWLASCRRLSSSLVVSRRLSSSLVVSRRLSSFVVVVASQICCHWGKLLQVTFHGCVTCEFATLVHCDLRENDMSRKKRDAFRCTGAAFCEIRRLLRSSIGISVWRVVFLGCWIGRAIGICVSGCGIEARFS